jgi:hypothetical protein
MLFLLPPANFSSPLVSHGWTQGPPGSAPDWQKGSEAEPDRVRVRYIPQTRWNNVWLSVSGVGFTAVDAAVNAIQDAAGWPQRF